MARYQKKNRTEEEKKAAYAKTGAAAKLRWQKYREEKAKNAEASMKELLQVVSLNNETDEDDVAKTFIASIEKKAFNKFCSCLKILDQHSGEQKYFCFDHWNSFQKTFNKERCGFDVVVKPRQIGFSTFELARDLFFALSEPNKNVVILAQEQGTAKRIMRTIRQWLRDLKQLEKSTREDFGIQNDDCISSAFLLTFQNNSSIEISWSKNDETAASMGGRGMSIHRLHATEVAYWEYADETMLAYLNASKNANEIILESTANGADGWFYRKFMDAYNQYDEDEKYKSHFYPWFLEPKNKISWNVGATRSPAYAATRADYETPKNEYEKLMIEKYHITAEQMRWWRNIVKANNNNLKKTIQEYPIDIETCFVSKGGNIMDNSDIEWLNRNVQAPLLKVKCPYDEAHELEIWSEPQHGKKYIMGIDCGQGIGGDPSAFTIIEKNRGEICAIFASAEIKPFAYAKYCVEIAKYYNNALMSIDRQGSGQTVVDRVTIDNLYKNVYKPGKDKEYGYFTGPNETVVMANYLQSLVNTKQIIFPDAEMVEQIKQIKLVNGKIIWHSKKSDSHDDKIKSYLYAEMVRREIPTFEEFSWLSSPRTITKDIRAVSKGIRNMFTLR